MRAPINNVNPRRPVLMKFLVRSWEYRQPRTWVRVRFACGIFNLCLAVVLLASGQWLGSLALLGLVPLAGSTLIFWTAYRLQTNVQG